MVNVVEETHSPKAYFSIDLTDEGMVMDVKDEQPLKAYSPIVVTDDGMVMDFKAKPRKALFPIVVTDEGISYEDDSLLGQAISVVLSLLNSTPSTIE